MPDRKFTVNATVRAFLFGGAFLVCQSCFSEQSPSNLASVRFESLTDFNGCDETFVAMSPDRALVLVIQIPNFLKRSVESDLPYVEEHLIEVGEVKIILERGEDLEHWCSDVMEVPPVIEEQWRAKSGTVRLNAIEHHFEKKNSSTIKASMPTTVIADVENVTFVNDGGLTRTVVLKRLSLTSVLGVFAGG